MGQLTVQLAEDTIPSVPDDPPAQLTITALAPLTDAAQALEDAGQPAPVGAAYRIDSEVFISHGLELAFSFNSSQLPEWARPSDLVLISEARMLFNDDSDEPDRFYEIVPAEVDDNAGVVRFNASTGGVFQLAAVRELPEWGSSSQESESGVEQKANPAPGFKPEVVFQTDCGVPLGKRASWKAAFETALNQAHKTYKSQGFPIAEVPLTLNVTRRAPRNRHLATTGMLAGRFMITTDLNRWTNEGYTAPQYQKHIAHEYFHVIQSMQSNAHALGPTALATWREQNAWFLEGTADWAMDMVFDKVPGEYHAPNALRFSLPLNIAVYDDVAYEVVAFWKWIEHHYGSGRIAAIVKAHGTHGNWALLSSGRLVRTGWDSNASRAYMKDLLTLFTPDPPDFLAFAAEALYLKRFDQDETGTEDLWHSNKLGPANQLPSTQDFAVVGTLRKGGDGDGEESALQLTRGLGAHLTANGAVFRTVSGAQALEGQLHVEVKPPSANHRIGFCLFPSTTHKPTCTPAPSSSTEWIELVVPMPPPGAGEVALIVADLQWPTVGAPQAAPPTVYNVPIKAWIEPSFPFITQDEVLLEGNLHAGHELKGTNPAPSGGGGPCPGMWATFQEMDTGHQRTKGRFVDQDGRPSGVAINFVRVERYPGAQMELLMDGTVEETPQYLYWARESNLNVDPTTWEIRVNYNRTPEVDGIAGTLQPYPPVIRELVWPRYLEVWTQVGNRNVERRVPLVWWRFAGTTTSNAWATVYKPPPNQSQVQCYVETAREQWDAELFFGDGNDVGQDSQPMVWSDPTKHHTQVGFIPTGNVAGYPVGPIKSNTTGGGCAGSEFYYADLFGLTKNRLRLNEQTTAAGDDCVDMPVPGSPNPDLQLRRDYILSGEQRLFQENSVQPLEYPITLRTH